jgi:RHS repeat-associated protein
VYNLFGLDLIGQDEGSQTRTLLADGLGSVRMEMVEDDVESVTTYGPYGNLLAQTGNDEPIAGTNYGYTGEQHDASTGLLYLRARYYNPALRSFMGRDPWSGNVKRPQSMNGWGYVDSNPVNLIDPSGLFPEHNCGETSQDIMRYVECVTDHYNVRFPFVGWEKPRYLAQYMLDKSGPLGTIQGDSSCYSGPVPYRASGYFEGVDSFGISAIGAQVVYDFATLQRRGFKYSGYGLMDSISDSEAESSGYVFGFRSWTSIVDDYKGLALFAITGISVGEPWTGFGYGLGVFGLSGISDYSVDAWGDYIVSGVGVDFLPLLDLGYIVVNREPKGTSTKNYIITTGEGETFVDRISLIEDIYYGRGSPWTLGLVDGRRSLVLPTALHYANVYIHMHDLNQDLNDPIQDEQYRRQK